MNKVGKVLVRQRKTFSLPVTLMVLMTLLTIISLSIVWSVSGGIEVKAAEGLDDRRPIGSSIEGYWSTAPNGYLLEDGSPYPCSGQYQNLCSVLGGTPGGTFNVPDSRGRIVVAKNAVDSEFLTLGQTGGATTVTLTTANLPIHDHNFSGRTIAWGNGGGNVHFRETGSDGDRIIAIGGATPASNGLYACQGCTNWEDTTNTGSGGAHNNKMPYITLNRAIKY